MLKVLTSRQWRPGMCAAGLRAFACGLALLAGCTDGNAPFEPGRAGQFALGLLPQFSTYGGSILETLPINRIRLLARDSATGAILGTSLTDDIDPAASGWTVSIDIRIPESDHPAVIIVSIELVHLVNGVEQVQWSGVTAPIRVAPGVTRALSEPVTVHPGPLTNLGVRSITIENAPEEVVEGDVVVLTSATVTDADVPATIFWSSLDGTVATVDAAGTVTTLRDGVARVVAQAGPRADTAAITVRQRPATIVVSPDTARADALGVEISFAAVVSDARGMPIDGTPVQWSVTGAAEHIGSGMVRATSNGTADISAAVEGTAIAANAVLIVTQQVATLDVEGDTLTFDGLQQGRQLEAIARDYNGNAINGAVSWSSTDEAVVRISADGLVTTTGIGRAAIVVGAGDVVTEIPVVVQYVPGSVRISESALHLDALGATATLTADVIATDGTVLDLPVNWVIDDPAVATIDTTGTVTAVAGGGALVTARHGSLSATATVRVEQAVVRVTVNPESVVIVIGSTLGLSAAALDRNGHAVPTPIVWSSADVQVATVDAAGTVTALLPGGTTMTAAAGGQTAQVAVSVAAPNLTVHGLHLSPDPVMEGGSLSAMLSVSNTGDAEAPPVAWRVRLFESEGGPVLAQAVARMPALQPGESAMPSISLTIGTDVPWPAMVVADATIDPDIVLLEWSTSDNHVTAAPVGIWMAVASIEIDTVALVLPRVGAASLLTAVVRDRHGRTLDRTVTWRTSDTDVIEVSSTGVVTARAAGTAAVVAALDDVADTVSVRVAAPNLTVALQSSFDVPLAAGAEAPVMVRVLNAGDGAAPESSLRIQLRADDVGEHTVSVAVPPLAAGAGFESTVQLLVPADNAWPATATIELVADPGSLIAESNETDNLVTSGPIGIRFPVASVTATPDELEFTALGATAVMEVTARDRHGRPLEDRSVMWSAQPEGVVTVGSDGTVEAVATGTASVIALVGAVADTIPVTVTQRPHTVTLVEPPAAVLVGQAVQLSADVHDAGGALITGASVVWSVVDGPAEIDAAGVLTATGHGTISVQASAGDATAMADIQALAPNLQVELLTTISQIVVGDSVEFVLRVRNTGAAPASASTLKLLLLAGGSDDVLGDSVLPLPSLAAGSSLDLPLALPVPAAIEWPATVRLGAVVDAGDDVVETDEEDNVARSETVHVHYPVATVVAEPVVMEFIALGATAQIDVSVRDVLGRTLTDRNATFTALDTAFARVDSDGLVTAMATGTTRVVVQAESQSDTVAVIVSQLPAALSIVEPPDALTAREAVTLFAAVADANGFAIPAAVVAWSSSDTAVIAMDGSTATAMAPGSATVEARIDTLIAVHVLAVVPGAPVDLIVVSGDDQVGRVAEALPQPLTVEVRDVNGFAVPGVLVRWNVDGADTESADGNMLVMSAVATGTDPDGTLSQNEATTDAVGRVAVTWTLGHRAGRHTSVAQLAGNESTVQFRADARAGPPARGNSRRGGGQSDLVVSLELADDLELEVTDEFGNPVADAAVRWTVQEGNGRFGEVTTQQTVTDANGLSSIEWLVGTRAGRTSVLAEVLDQGVVVGSAEFVNHTKPGPLKKLNLQPKTITLTVLEGDTIFTVDPRDEFDNPISGVEFVWSSNNEEILVAASAGPGLGRGTSKKNGSAKVTVRGTAAGVESFDSATVLIEQEAVAGITVTRSGDIVNETATVSLLLDGTIELTASGLDANNRTITQFRWSVVDSEGSGNITFDGSANADQQPTVTIRGAALGELMLQVSDPKRSTVRIIRVNVLPDG